MTKRQEYMYIYLGLRVPVQINTLASLCNGVDNEYTIQGSFKSFLRGVIIVCFTAVLCIVTAYC